MEDCVDLRKRHKINEYLTLAKLLWNDLLVKSSKNLTVEGLLLDAKNNILKMCQVTSELEHDLELLYEQNYELSQKLENAGIDSLQFLFDNKHILKSSGSININDIKFVEVNVNNNVDTDTEDVSTEYNGLHYNSSDEDIGADPTRRSRRRNAGQNQFRSNTPVLNKTMKKNNLKKETNQSPKKNTKPKLKPTPPQLGEPKKKRTPKKRLRTQSATTNLTLNEDIHTDELIVCVPEHVQENQLTTDIYDFTNFSINRTVEPIAHCSKEFNDL